MKRLLFIILALCGWFVGLQAQNTNTTDSKGVTSQGQLDTVRNTRLNPATQDEPIQSNFVDQFGKTGQRPGLSPHGQRLNAVVKLSGSVITCSISWDQADMTTSVADSGDYALPVIERGVCYGLEANPTLTMTTVTKVVDTTISGNGYGDFEVSLSGLQPGTTYHACAYAVTMYDTVYGDDIPISTLARTYCTVTDAHIDDGIYTTTTGGLEALKSGSNNEILTVTDQDGNVYPVVQIGSQCWMAVNLRTKHYSDGTVISTSNSRSYYYPYYYDYSSSNIPLVQRGYLYNWKATMNGSSTEGAQGVCPTGWHVPTRNEYDTMISAAGASYTTGAVYLSGSCLWNGLTSATDGMTPNSYNNPDRNNSGFSAVPAGYFFNIGSSYQEAGRWARFWSSTLDDPNARFYYIIYNDNHVYDIGRENTECAHSVRCLRDVALNLASTAVGGYAYICSSAPATTRYTAMPSNGIEGYTFEWEDDEGPIMTDGSSNTFEATYNTPGTYTVTCTATGHGMSLTNTITTVVTNGDEPSFTTCEDNLSVTLKTKTHVDTIHWDNSHSTVNPVVNDASYTYSTAGVYTFIAVSSHGCRAFKTVGLNTTLHPCTLALAAHTNTSNYTGTAANPGTGGRETETSTGSKIIKQVTDQDGNVYPVSQIGGQCWMAENLRTKHYDNTMSNFSTLSLTETNNANTYHDAADRFTSGYYTAPGNNGVTSDLALVSLYGHLYNGAAMMAGAGSSTTPNQIQGICPKGWHVPSKSEYETLLAIDNTDIAVKLSKGCSWQESNDAMCANDYSNPQRNSLGFGALPAGCLVPDYYQYYEFTRQAFFWTSYSPLSQRNSAFRIYYAYGIGYQFESCSSDRCMAVRCLRDITLDMTSTATNGKAYTCGSTPASVTYNVTPSNTTTGYTYSWSPAGGTTTNGGRSYTLSYSTSGTYMVTCTAVGYGLTVSNTITTEVVPGEPYFTHSEDNKKVTLANFSCYAKPNTVIWEEGGSSQNVGNNTSLTHTYSSNGTYTITATSASGCTYTTDVSVDDYMHADMSCAVTSRNTNESGYCNVVTGLMDYDGNNYAVVKIGNQCWMAQSLRVKHFANGTAINQGSGLTTNYAWYNPPQGSGQITTYGLMYNWYTAMGNSNGNPGVCPTGWHVPNNSEVQTLYNTVNNKTSWRCDGTSGNVANALSGKEGWGKFGGSYSCNSGFNKPTINASGFNGVPSGTYTGGYNDAGRAFYFWTRTENNWRNYRLGEYTNLKYDNHDKQYGFSVRCVRN